jgi:hypothetical protein
MTMILSKLLPLTLQQQCNKTVMPPALQVVVGARDDVFNSTDLQIEALVEITIVNRKSLTPGP